MRRTDIGRAAALAALVALGGCDDPAKVGLGSELEVVLEGVRPVDPAQGTLHLWVFRGSDTVHAAPVPPVGDDGTVRMSVEVPMADPAGVLVTLESPRDADPAASPARLLSGTFRGGEARLAIEGAVTAGPPLVEEPGAHSLFTTSNNSFGGTLSYPSFEDAGLWLFTLLPSRNRHGTREVRVTPLRPGWTYEGWAVHRPGTPGEVWVSYGKFRPDVTGLLSSRDDTGSGPFSGDVDYLNSGVEDVPGEEWYIDTVAVQLGLEIPGGLPLPFDLDAVDPATGEAVWHHVITIEPAFDQGEPLYTGLPFLLRPYGNPIGPGGPGDPRTIRRLDDPPRGVARAR